jgi:hypothetical protein
VCEPGVRTPVRVEEGIGMRGAERKRGTQLGGGAVRGGDAPDGINGEGGNATQERAAQANLLPWHRTDPPNPA